MASAAAAAGSIDSTQQTMLQLQIPVFAGDPRSPSEVPYVVGVLEGIDATEEMLVHSEFDNVALRNALLYALSDSNDGPRPHDILDVFSEDLISKNQTHSTTIRHSVWSEIVAALLATRPFNLVNLAPWIAFLRLHDAGTHMGKHDLEWAHELRFMKCALYLVTEGLPLELQTPVLHHVIQRGAVARRDVAKNIKHFVDEVKKANTGAITAMAGAGAGAGAGDGDGAGAGSGAAGAGAGAGSGAAGAGARAGTGAGSGAAGIGVSAPSTSLPIHYNHARFSIHGNQRMLRIRSKACNYPLHPESGMPKFITSCENVSWLMHGTLLAGIHTHRTADSPHMRASFERYERLSSMAVEAAIIAGIHVRALELEEIQYRSIPKPKDDDKTAAAGVSKGGGGGGKASRRTKTVAAGGNRRDAAAVTSSAVSSSSFTSFTSFTSSSSSSIAQLETSNVAIVHRLLMRLEQSMSFLEEQAAMTDQNDASILRDMIRACTNEIRVSKNIRAGIDNTARSLLWFSILDFAQHMPLTMLVPLIGQELDARSLLSPTSRIIAVVACVKTVTGLAVPPSPHPTYPPQPSAEPAPASTHVTKFAGLVRRNATAATASATSAKSAKSATATTAATATTTTTAATATTTTSTTAASSGQLQKSLKTPIIFKHAHAFDNARLTRDLLDMISSSASVDSIDTVPSSTPTIMDGTAAIGTRKSAQILQHYIREKVFGQNPLEVFAKLPDAGADPLLLSPHHPFLGKRILGFAVAVALRDLKGKAMHEDSVDKALVILKYCGTLEGVIEGFAAHMAHRKDSHHLPHLRFGHMGNTIPQTMNRLVCDVDRAVYREPRPASYPAFFSARTNISLVKRNEGGSSSGNSSSNKGGTQVLRLASTSPATTLTRLSDSPTSTGSPSCHSHSHSPPPPQLEEEEEEEEDEPGQQLEGDCADDQDEEEYIDRTAAGGGQLIVSMAASDIWIAHGMPEGLFAGDAFARHVFKSLMAKWKELNGAEEGKALIGTIIWPADAVPLEACPVAMRWAGAGTGLRAERGTLSVGVASLVIWVGKTRAQMLLKDTKGLFCTRHAVGEMFVMGKRPRLNQYWVPVVPLQSYSLFSLNLRAEGILKADHGKSSLTLAEFFMVSIVNEARRRGLMMLFTDGTSPPAPDELPITPYDQVHKSTDTFIRNSLTMSCIKACALMSVASLVHASRGEAVDGPPFRQAMIHTFQSDDRWGILPFWHWRPTTEHIETSPIKDIMNYLFTTDQTGVDALDATLWPHEYVRKFVGNALRRHLFKCPRVSEQ